jgi:arachidonate 15-lipoxygenase
MASGAEFRAGAAGDEKYAYDYTYLPPLAFAKSVPGLGFSLQWALLVGVVALRILVNLIALKIDSDLTTLDRRLSNIVEDIEAQQFTAAILALVGVIADLVRAYADAARLEQQAAAIVMDIETQDFTKARQDFAVLFATISSLISAGLPSGPAKSLDDYKNLFKTLPLPAIANTFQDDAVFADMRVAGPNPLVITKLTVPLDKFPITNQQFQSVMGVDDDLSTAIAQGRVYLADYGALDWLVDGSWLTYQKYLWAPIAMFAVPQGTGPDRRLQAVGIQAEQQPGPSNPIVLRPPSGSSSPAWDKAKTAVQIADGNYHEAVSHLGQTHLVVEAFIMATQNQLSGHPVAKLLQPHFEGTLFINNAAQSALIAPGGTVDAIFGGTIDSSRVAAVKGAQAVLFNFDTYSPLEQLAARGVDNAQQLPYYPYRDVASPIWDAILGWATDYVTGIYASEAGPAADARLQQWVAELTSHQGGRIKKVGTLVDGVEKIETRTQLAKIVAIIIFTASAQHSAVNFPQASIMAFAPAMPLAGYSPLPSDTAWLTMLPPLDQALTQLNVGTLLGSVHYTRLGEYESGYFTDPNIQRALARFQEALASIEMSMQSSGLTQTYPYLLPSLIPQSINI